MAISVSKLPPILETWFLDEARTIATAVLAGSGQSVACLGSRIKRLAGVKPTAGWALPVSCPAGDNLATYLAIQYVRDNAGKGRWVLIISQEESQPMPEVGLWSYLQSVMGWEVGVVGAVVAGYVRDIEEIEEKLGKEFGVFGWGACPIRPDMTANGSVGFPVQINGVTIRAGDLIVGDKDGVVCVPRDEVESTIEKCRQEIVNEVNVLQHVREGHGPIEVLGLEKLLEGNVDIEE